MAAPRKGILKTSSSFDKEADAHRAKETKWDEMNILATHHPPDKDYGHMKIDEPPTPYSKYSDQEDDVAEEEGSDERRGSVGNKVDISSLSERLEDIEDHRERRVSTGEDNSSDEEDETDEHKVDRLKFEQKRKLHYNEFQAVKLAKQLMEEEEDDEEETEQPSCKVVDNVITDTGSMQMDQASSLTTETTESQSEAGNVSEKKETLIN